MPQIQMNFTAKEIEEILMAHINSLSLAATKAKSVSWKISRGSNDPRESSSDNVLGATIYFQ